MIEIKNKINQHLEDKKIPLNRGVMIEGGSIIINSAIKFGIIGIIRVYYSPISIPDGILAFNKESLEIIKEISTRPLGDGFVKFYSL